MTLLLHRRSEAFVQRSRSRPHVAFFASLRCPSQLCRGLRLRQTRKGVAVESWWTAAPRLQQQHQQHQQHQKKKKKKHRHDRGAL